MPKCFISETPTMGDPYLLGGEDAHHVRHVLRMTPGEALTLCTPAGMDYDCVITGFTAQEVILRLRSCRPNTAETKEALRIYQCLPKGDKLEQVIQKSTELGAAEIVPVQSSRCIAKLTPATAQRKQSRWQKIAETAAKQSGRGRIPEIPPARSFQQALLRAAREGTVLLFYEGGGRPLRDLLAEQKGPLSLFIGPEGGFSPEEVQLAKTNGASIVTLGQRILRTETVAPAVLSMILYARNEL